MVMKKTVIVLLGILVSIAGIANPQAFAQPKATFKFINNSGIPNDKVFLWVISGKASHTGNTYLDSSTWTLQTKTSPVTSMTFSLGDLESTDGIQFNAPAIDSGRIYFSYQSDFDALTFDCVEGEPACTSNDHLIYDKIEICTYTDNMNINTTNVDFWSIPFTFGVTDKNPPNSYVTYGWQTDIPDIRDTIFSQFSNVPDMATQTCSNSVIYRENLVQTSGGTTWRVVAPDKVGTEWGDHLGYFSAFWNDYIINKCWVPNREFEFTDENAQTYYGSVDGAGEVLTVTGTAFATYSRPAWETYPSPWPDPNLNANYGHVLFGGTGEFAAGASAPVICRAILRGVMDTDGTVWNNPDYYYQGDNSPDSPVLHYGKILHQYGIDHKVYAISYDDDHSPAIYFNEGEIITITLLPFAGGGAVTPTPPGTTPVPPVTTPTPPGTTPVPPVTTPTPRIPPWITDFNGDGTSDIAIFRGSSGLWAIRKITRVYFGGTTDVPVPGDYNGDGTTEIGIFRATSGLWAIRSNTRAYFGSGSDLPEPGDYDGDGTAGIGIFRSASGLWAIRGVTRIYFGGSADSPAPGYYYGDTRKDIGIFRESSGLWAVRDVTRVYFGSTGDDTVPGDYNGDGAWDCGIFLSSSGLWAIRDVTRQYFGSSSDSPVPGNYEGTGKDDIGIFRESSGLWDIQGITRVYYGGTGDMPVTR